MRDTEKIKICESLRDEENNNCELFKIFLLKWNYV